MKLSLKFCLVTRWEEEEEDMSRQSSENEKEQPVLAEEPLTLGRQKGADTLSFPNLSPWQETWGWGTRGQ